MTWKSSTVLFFVWMIVCLTCKSSANNVEEDGISVYRRNRTYFSDRGENHNRVCTYTRGDGLLQRLEWLQNGEVYSSGIPTVATHLLSINNVTLSHAGEYSCRGVLMDGTTAGPVSAGFINVLDSSMIIVPPRQYVLEGGNLTLQCSSSLPGTSTLWQHSSTSVETITNAQVATELAGMYQFTCVILHTGGADTISKATEAIVVVPPKITSHSETPLTVNGNVNQYSLTASFQSRTQDTTTITWQKQGSNEQLQAQTSWLDDYGRGNTSLVFDTLSRSDSGRYTVTVTNSNGVIPLKQRTVSVDLELKVSVPPALPTDFTATMINSTVYQLTWTLTDQTPDQQATSLAIVIQQPSPTVLSVPSPNNQEFIFYVEPGTSYEVALTATNMDGDVTTEPVRFTTEPSAPLISSVKAQRLNSTTFDILLDLQYTGGGDITSITVTFDDLPQVNAGTPYEVERNKWRSLAVSDHFGDLEYSSDVQFSVQVDNQEGFSRAMAVQQSFIRPGPPSQPTVLPDSTTDTSFVLLVELPTTGTVPVTTIAVEVMDRNGLVTAVNITGEFSHGQLVEMGVMDLSPGFQYTVVAYAVNAGGRGPNSDPATVNTGGTHLPIPLEALIGITVVGSVIITISLILSIICCVYCFRRCKGGEKYCTADYGEHPNGKVLEAAEIASKSSSYFGNPQLSREGAYTPRSPTLTSRSSSCVPPTVTEYSYEGSEADSVFPGLHKKQPDVYEHSQYPQYPHFQCRQSPAPLPPLNLQSEQPLSNSSTVLSPDPDYASPPATALSYATDV